MSLNEQIQKDLEQALKNKKETEILALRMLKNAVKNASIQKKGELDDAEIIKIIRSEIKKRNESIEAFKQGQRSDLVKKEQAELEVLKNYLPQELSDDEIKELIKEAIEVTKAEGSQNFGQIMGVVMKKIAGQADGSKVSQLVKEELAALSKK